MTRSRSLHILLAAATRNLLRIWKSGREVERRKEEAKVSLRFRIGEVTPGR